jgi:DNA-binding transcriptional MerR regulator
VRSYDLTELEEMSALSRRTISDYISRGLLIGPSHRGRGARYSQRDLDALRVIPRLRTVLKPEFPNLHAVRAFLEVLTIADLRHLVRLTNERVFEVEVRRIRILNRLKPFLPAIPPESISQAMHRLTPEQICGFDRGQIQIGSLLDIERMAGMSEMPAYGTEFDVEADVGADVREDSHLYMRNGNGNGNGANGELAAAANGNGQANDNGSGDSRWERFGNSTVQVRIEKRALGNVRGKPSLSDAIQDFAQQIETLLKASG